MISEIETCNLKFCKLSRFSCGSSCSPRLAPWALRCAALVHAPSPHCMRGSYARRAPVVPGGAGVSGALLGVALARARAAAHRRHPGQLLPGRGRHPDRGHVRVAQIVARLVRCAGRRLSGRRGHAQFRDSFAQFRGSFASSFAEFRGVSRGFAEFRSSFTGFRTATQPFRMSSRCETV